MTVTANIPFFWQFWDTVGFSLLLVTLQRKQVLKLCDDFLHANKSAPLNCFLTIFLFGSGLLFNEV